MEKGINMLKSQDQVQEWLVKWLQDNADIPLDSIDIDKPFADYYLDSLTSVELSYDLEEWSEKELTATVVWNYPTINKMSEYLSNSEVDESMDGLITKIENMSDEQANCLLLEIEKEKK